MYNHIKLREECLRNSSRERAERQGEAIPNRGAKHWEGTFLLGGGASKVNMEKTLFSWTGGAEVLHVSGIRLRALSVGP